MFKMSSRSSNAGVETTAPLISGSVNIALSHSSPHISQTMHQIIRILYFCLVDSLLKYALDFVISWIEVRAVRCRRRLVTYLVKKGKGAYT